MNAAQHTFVREQFTKWVEETDAAEQCGLTREELINSVEFNEGDAGLNAKIQTAFDKFNEGKRRHFVDGEVVTIGGRFVDPERVRTSGPEYINTAGCPKE
jgi:hypothetical protein